MSHNPRPQPAAQPTLDDELASLLAERHGLRVWLDRRLAAGVCSGTGVIHSLSTLSLIGRRLALTIAQRPGQGADRFDHFLSLLARYALEQSETAESPSKSREQSETAENPPNSSPRALHEVPRTSGVATRGEQ